MPEKKKAHHKHAKTKSEKHGDSNEKAKKEKKKKGKGACSCVKKQDVESDADEFPDELQPLLEEHDEYAGGDYESAPEEAAPLPVTEPLLPPKDDSPRRWGRRPPLVEVSLFLYNLAYRASIPLKEQVVFGAIASQYSPSVADFIQSNDVRQQACLASVLSRG